MIKLYPKRSYKVPIDAKCVTPDFFSDKSVNEIAALQVWHGNQKRTLGELFKINSEKEAASDSIDILGDVGKVRSIGAKMSIGKIFVEGAVGTHLGEEMSGGEIIVTGNVDSWAGSMMKSGIIEINGDASDYVGATYRGSTKGMEGGKIIVHGNAGNEAGCYMRGGIIKIFGDVGQFAGVHMRNGTIFIKGNSEGRVGAEMLGGKIVLCGYIPSILPTFTIVNIQPKAKVEGKEVLGPFYQFVGDLAEGGNGKLYVSQTRNKHLKFYEKYL